MSHPLPIIGAAERLGIRLEARGERLHVDAPKGVLTPELAETLRVHKAAILAALQATTGAKGSAQVIPFVLRRITVHAGYTPEGAEIRRIVNYS